MAHAVRPGPADGPVVDEVELSYEGRLLRRRRLVGRSGRAIIVDLPVAVSLDEGDLLVLQDGGLVGVRAAEEELTEVRGDLARLAWHIGNRHTPCRIEADHLVIRRDPVLAGMLQGLGARLADATGPFRPEGGAYGHGRTMGHSHAGAEHGHGHDHHQGHHQGHHHGHDHDHQHGHDHDG